MNAIKKRKKIIFLTIAAIGMFVGAAVAFADSLKFFEFTPKTSNDSLKISSAEGTPYQFFKPYNDFISGFDVWIENSGGSGSVSFGLRDENDNLLAAKTVSAPFVSKIWGGSEFRVDFNSPVQISSGRIYKIKILSSMPELRFYHAEKMQPIAHNAPFSTEDTLGSAYLGENEQSFAFKLALYEDGDTLSPVVSGVTSTIVSQNEEKIEFSANEPVDYKIVFTSRNGGAPQTFDYGGKYVLCPPAVAVCAVSLGVSPNSVYDYQLFIKDEWGNEAQLSGFFETMVVSSEVSSPDTPNVPPQQTEEQPEEGSGAVEQRSSGAGDENQSETNSQIVSKDSQTYSGGNQTPVSADSAGEGAAVEAFESGNGGGIVVVWDAPEGGEPNDGYRIDVFDENKKLVKQISVAAGIHRLEISGLKPGEYTVIIYANNGGIFEKIAEELVVTISEKQPIIGSFMSYSRYFYLGLMFFAAVVVLAALIIRRRKISKTAGFTIAEVVIGFSVLAGIVLMIALFSQNVFRFGGFFSESLKVQQEVRQTFQQIITEMRSVGPSNLGSYPIKQVGTSSLAFYSDIDKDGLFEEVRYFLDGATLKKGIIKPTGSPLSYNPANETIIEAVHGVVATSSGIFAYYDNSYTGSETPMTFPVTISDIRVIKTEMVVKPGAVQESFSIWITPRNLRNM